MEGSREQEQGSMVRAGRVGRRMEQGGLGVLGGVGEAGRVGGNREGWVSREQ